MAETQTAVEPEASLATGSFSGPYSERLTAFMETGWGRLEEAALSPAPPAGVLAERRERLRRALPAPLWAVVPAGQPARRTNDQLYPFRPNSDYVWLCGDQTPGGVLVLDPASAAGDVLYVQPPSRRDNGEFYRSAAHGELWVGRRPSLEAREECLGIRCRPLDEAAGVVAGLGAALVSRGFDAAVEEWVEPAGGILDGELVAVLSELRLVKDAWELAELRAAVHATARGFCDVAEALLGGGAQSERHVEVAFAARARLEGNGVGYVPVAAAGSHATILHWNRNDGPVEPGDLVLLDAGAETGTLYTADVTRTFPAGGRFSGLQRQVYEYVLAAQEAGLATLKPGVDFREYHRACIRVLAEGLEDLGVLPVPAAESLDPDCELHRRYTLHSPGHMLGLDVHDCARARQAHYLGGPLTAGQVLTVEPGLYFQPNDETVPEALRGIGVRIEDDVVVTEAGCAPLSFALPRRPDDVEAWCASPELEP